MQRKKYKNLKKRYGIFVDAPVGTPIEIYLDDVNGKNALSSTPIDFENIIPNLHQLKFQPTLPISHLF